jgi:hypothetical protein
MTSEDRFEQELAALQPRGPSAELRRRIAEDLAATPRREVVRITHVWRSWAVVGGLLAASLVAVVVWRGGGPTIELPANPPLETNVATAFDESFPTLWSYRCALSRSSQSLDELLSRHAAQTLEHKAGGAPVLIVARFNSEMESLLGEL